jgi:DNA invertase Pin-like site-specific DNA recombinase
MRNLRRRLAPQTIAELVARYNGGEHTPALSRQYGISKTGLLQLLQDKGVPLRRRSVTPEDAERAVRLYERGLTIDEVVKPIGYSYSTVQRLLHQKGVVLRTGAPRRR